MGCEGREVASTSERRQRDRIIRFEAKWADLRFQRQNEGLDTLVRTSSNPTKRSANLRHGLLGGPISASFPKSASRSDRQIVASAALETPMDG